MKKLKGKNLFTQKEINELKRLITLRVNSINKSEKKKLRDNMRKIGFYGRDDFGIFDCKVSDLERLIKQGRITVVDYKSTNNTCNNFNIKESANKENIIDYTSAEKELTEGEFKTVSSLSDQNAGVWRDPDPKRGEHATATIAHLRRYERHYRALPS